jgi:small subunit ribosomal protein S21
MIEIEVRTTELIDKALKRLKTRVMTEGILENVWRKRAFETPQEKRKRKQKLMHKAAKYFR